MTDLNDCPELQAVVQAIQSGPLGANADVVQLAAGLRMVADAIDPPPMVQAMQDVAETLRLPVLPRPSALMPHCADCGRTGVPPYHCSAVSYAQANRDAAGAATANLLTGADNVVQLPPVWVSKMPGPCATCGSNTHLTISCRATVQEVPNA